MTRWYLSMLGFFERLVNPFPEQDPSQAPKSIFAFCVHHSRGLGFPLFVLALSTSLVAIFEVALFSFMGDLVNWIAENVF